MAHVNGGCCQSFLAVSILNIEGLGKSALDWFCNRKGACSLVRLRTASSRYRAAEGLACRLANAAINADDERLLDHIDSRGGYCSLAVSIRHVERLSERALDRLSDAESTSASVRLSTTRRRNGA